jgi:hypothetical protein
VTAGAEKAVSIRRRRRLPDLGEPTPRRLAGAADDRRTRVKDAIAMATNDDELDEDLLDDAEDMPEDLDEEDLELDEDVDLEEDVDLDAEEADEDEVEGDIDEEEVDGTEVRVKAPALGDEEEEEEEDEDDSDDVEKSLDEILKTRLVQPEDEDEEDEDDEIVDGDDRGESPLRVLPKQPGEFVCQSCFLVKHPSQLADRDSMLCRDCV